MKFNAAAESDLLGGVHPDIAHLGWLVGSWGGIFNGETPAGEPFMFEQEAQFFSDGRPFLEYRSYSWIVDEDRKRINPSHTEQGYWRGTAENGVEAVIVNPMGICEVYVGRVIVGGLENATITRAELQLNPVEVALTPTAPAILSPSRMYGLVNGRLLTTFDMATGEHDAKPHVWISMEKL